MATAASLIAHSLAPATTSGYFASFELYRAFCRDNQVRDVLPPVESVVLAFVSSLFLKQTSAGVAMRALTGIRSVCRLLGTSCDGLRSSQLDYLMRSYKRLLPSTKRIPREPATYDIVRRWCDFLASHRSTTGSELPWRVARALLLVMFHAFLRAGEATAGSDGASGSPPLRSHVSFFSDHFVLYLPESKTDIFRAGIHIRVAANGSSLCPLALLRAAVDSAPDKRPSAPLFQNPDGSACSYAQLSSLVTYACLGCSIDASRYKPHSLRIGAATTAALLGFPESVIKVLGRWSSVCYQIYTRMTPARFAKVSAAFASSSSVSLEEYGGMRGTSPASIDFDNLAVVFGSCARGPALADL